MSEKEKDDKDGYNSYLSSTDIDALRDEAKLRVEEGFTAVRLYPFGSFGNRSFSEGIGLEKMSYTAMQRHAVERIEAVRDSVGPDIDIMIDVVNRLTPAEAIAIGNALSDYNLYFFFLTNLMHLLHPTIRLAHYQNAHHFYPHP